MRVVTLLDTQTASTNLGDGIIMDAVRRELADLLPEAFLYSVASHEWMGGKSRSLLRRSDTVVAGGTNLLSSRMWFKPLWKLSPIDVIRGHDVTLLGAGWYQHQRSPDAYTRLLLGRVLSARGLHSVRDGYTLGMLAKAGVANAVNTGCPTMWRLTPEHCADIPAAKGLEVVATLNTYIPDRGSDGRLIDTLVRHYDRVHFWIQTQADYEYARSFGHELSYLNPSVSALDELLASSVSVDYVGNRLHAGIRALQHRRRTVIVEIDNRALEMGRDFGLPTVARNDFDTLTGLIEDPLHTEIDLPTEAIARWKASLEGALEP